MRDLFKLALTAIGCIIGIWCIILLFLKIAIEHPCLKSHEEIQYIAPIGMVVGGGKNGGGISIPLGNMEPVQVKVCDKYK